MASNLGLPALTEERRQLLSRRIRLFVAATISYKVLEAIIALTEGTRVSSAALIGFGLDSVIEVSSAAAEAWQFAGKDPEAREKIALKIIAFSFFGLALYVIIDAIRSLFGIGEGPAFDCRYHPGRRQPGGHARAVLGAAPCRS